MSTTKDEGKTVDVPGGFSFPIDDAPRIKHSFLGRSANGRTNSVARQLQPGVALYGDGETSTRVFEAVIPDKKGGSSIIIISGTDPLLTRKEDGTVPYEVGKRREVATMAIEKTMPTGDAIVETNETYQVLSDGSVRVPRNSLEQEGIARMNHHDQRTQGMELGSMIIQELGNSLAT